MLFKALIRSANNQKTVGCRVVMMLLGYIARVFDWRVHLKKKFPLFSVPLKLTNNKREKNR